MLSMTYKGDKNTGREGYEGISTIQERTKEDLN